MASSIGNFVCEIRNFLDQGFRGLPTILASCIFLLGLLQGNLTYIFFFVGLFIVAPLSVLGFNGLFSWLYTLLKGGEQSSMFYSPTGGAEQCLMFPVFPSATLGGSMFVVPSYWVTIISFFFIYLFINAVSVYLEKSQEGASDEAVRRRKFQTGSSMFVILAFYIIFMILRYSSSGCETPLGMITGFIVGGTLSYGWYEAMKACGLGIFDDIFGIKTQMLVMESQKIDPTVYPDLISENRLK
jgi:hypothetical protein